GRVAGGEGADLGRAGCAASRGADVAARASIAVAARGPIGSHRVRAHAGGRVAGPRRVALVRRGADRRRAALASARLAGVAIRAGVAVGARPPVGGRRVGAEPAGRVAGPRYVALVRRRADDRRSTANTGGALIAGGADVAVVAAGAVSGGRVRAGAASRV